MATTVVDLRIIVNHDGTLREDDVERAVMLAIQDTLTFDPVGEHQVVRLVDDGFGRIVPRDTSRWSQRFTLGG